MDQRSSISIAVLTRSQDDVELVNATLRGAGHAAHCHWAPDPNRFEEALSAGHIELVVLCNDHYGDDLRQVVEQKDIHLPELPVVALQRDVNEDAIQRALGEGARDLVSTRSRSRWVAVMLRELRAFRVERALISTVNAASEYKRQLHDYMQRSENAIAYAQDGIITKANSAWVSCFQAVSEDEIVGLPLMDCFDVTSHAAIRGALVATLKGKWRSDEKLEVHTRLGNGEYAGMGLWFRLVEFEDGPHVQVEIARDEEPAEAPDRTVPDALKRDPTTLFFHRTEFLERLQKRTESKPASGLQMLACIKPDHFANVQKDVGILASEEILAQLAEQLRTTLHPRDFAGRFEGTTLIALLERGNEYDAEVWGRQLAALIQDYEFEVGGQIVHLTCSVGVCPVSPVFSDLEELVSATMAALANARKAGGNAVRLSDADDRDTRLRRFDAIWVKRIRAALMENRFRLAQLPVATLRSEAGSMSDMLVRMLDEQGNAVLPSEFLPAAERNNLMKTIDRWMITASLNYCRDENADCVFVRLSRQSLQDGSLVEWVRQELERLGVEGGRVCMQVSERQAAKYIKPARKIADAFRAIGVRFALEHYGVDKNRFQILDVLKPDFVKIDGELMHTLTRERTIQDNVGALASAATRRGIKTIAERVENANAMAVLFQLGIDFMQGHYVHEPEVVLQEPPEVATNSLDTISTN